MQEIRTGDQYKAFEKHLLDDLEALKFMLREEWFEDDIQRIGSEQEMDIIDALCRPVLVGNDIVAELDRPDVTEEYARFNLEINSDPIELKNDCFEMLYRQLLRKLNVIQEKSLERNAAVLLTGILPTLRNSDLSLGALSPNERYKTLLRLINKRRGRNYEYHIEGIDQLITRENPAVYGGSFTSFQAHLQIPSSSFAEAYNWAQAIAGPVLAACTNSPVFLGKRLWHETRIALFGQTTDTRKPYENLINENPRVTFGENYVTKGVFDLFKRDLSHYKAFVMTDSDGRSLEKVLKGEMPALKALRFHNGTIYRWNRPCIGTDGERPHLRIENRYIPAGPTLLDEIANAAFWVGLMEGRPEGDDIPARLPFEDARTNFTKAAQLGLEVQFRWHDRKLIPAQELILEHLLPMAREGLLKKGIEEASIRKYLDIIEERVTQLKTGSFWMLDSLEKLNQYSSQSDSLLTITSFCRENCLRPVPAHQWPTLGIKQMHYNKTKDKTAEDIMHADLITLRKDDLLAFGKQVMKWSHLTHVTVEDERGKLCGILAYSDIPEKVGSDQSVEDVMIRNFYSVSPNTPFQEIKKLMAQHKLHCLPVMTKGVLAGIITRRDMPRIVAPETVKQKQ